MAVCGGQLPGVQMLVYIQSECEYVNVNSSSLSVSSIKLVAVQDLLEREALDKVKSAGVTLVGGEGSVTVRVEG